ncbi:hypothetical protein BYT27DRAFT_7237264 [Phlegmacium glaucopus]|nr:hypothetical protein BYT27DRAFT_7237264 [Phlegmacium glaucopus]
MEVIDGKVAFSFVWSLQSPYHYFPTEGVAIAFIILLVQATFYRMWWLFPTIYLCGVLEVLGWSARLWSSFSPLLGSPFKSQSNCCNNPGAAANFVIFGVIIHRVGVQYIRLSPKAYTIFFVTCVSVVYVLSVASGLGKDPTKGGRITLGGIGFQLFVIVVYVFCAGEFFIRYLQRLPVRGGAAESSEYNNSKLEFTKGTGGMNHKTRLMVVALIFSTLCLLIRAVYRTIELSNGWNGRIISTQVLFNVLDGAMITLAMYTMNFAHPGLLLGRVKGLPDIHAREILESKIPSEPKPE